MKNLALIATVLFLISSCSTSSDFSKRKYTNGRVQYAPTTGVKTHKSSTEKETKIKLKPKRVEQKQSQKTANLNQVESSYKEVKKVKQPKSETKLNQGPILVKKGEKQLIDEPVSKAKGKPTKAEKKANRKNKRKREKVKLKQLAKTVLYTVLGATIALALISLTGDMVITSMIYGIFLTQPIAWLILGLGVLLLIYFL